MYQGGIQLVAIGGTLNALASLAIAWRLYISYRHMPSKAQEYFMKFYLYFGIFYLAFASSQLLFVDNAGAVPVGIFHIVSYFFLYLSIGYLLSFPFLLSEREFTAKRILLFVLLFNILYAVLRVVYFEPSVHESLAAYSYWRPVFPEWMRIITGVFAILAAGFSSFLFFKRGVQSRKESSFIFQRSFWLGSGILLLVFASLAAFIAAPSGSFVQVVVATFLVLAGLLTIMRGAFLRRSETEPHF